MQQFFLRFLPKIQLSSRRDSSVVFLAFLSIFFIFNSFFTPGFGDSFSSNKGWVIFFSFFRMVSLFPLIIWSFREILVFKKGIISPLVKASYLSLLVLLPSIICWFKLFFSTSFQKTEFHYYFIPFIFVLIAVFFISSRIYGFPPIFLDTDSFLKKKAFCKLFIMASCFWGSLFFLIFFGNIYMLLFMFAVVIFNDTTAYLFGSRYGKNRIFKHSGSKTLEGLLFPIIFLTFFFLIIALAAYGNGVKTIYLFGKNISLFFLPISGFLFSLIGSIGDLSFSKQKRLFRIKDYSNLLGIQGGFWDRFDSHTFALTSFYIFASCLILF